MCGIAGIFYEDSSHEVELPILEKMVRKLYHRGPDEQGLHIDGTIGIGMRRLSIIDLAGGSQPIHNEDKTIWVVFNGEIFNYPELRNELEKKGHRFYTRSDTEVLVHCYEQYGENFFSHLNGQFGIALWDSVKKRLILARDRVGIRPLFYKKYQHGILFGSEIKAIFEHPAAGRELDPVGLEQIFTIWVNIPPRTPFKGISELPPGHYMTVDDRGVRINQWWKLQFPELGTYEDRPLSFYKERLNEVLHDATAIRLRADVPVAAYLSGGLDSSIITALVKKHHNNDLITFSVVFNDKSFDERSYQQTMIDFLETDHRFTEVSTDSIGDLFTEVIYFAERPMIRTAPAPLLALSKLVRDNNIKVVLTGEGADEMFGGYNIFKEDKIRRFWARSPHSSLRPRLLESIYPYVNKSAPAFWQAFFKKGLVDVDDPFYSHRIRWNNMSFMKQFFSEGFKTEFNEQKNVFEPLQAYIDPDILRWHPLCRAQYLEISLFMSGYLLNSQGDRMMMGNSVEGRFPFLDHRVIEFAATVPPRYKIDVLNEKFLLKKAFESYLPADIVNRPKQPYRAPIAECFIHPEKGNRGAELLKKEHLEQKGCLNADITGRYIEKLRTQPPERTGERDDMAVAGLVSTQLLSDHFISP